MAKFKNLEEAQAAFDKLSAEFKVQEDALKNTSEQLADATKVVAELQTKLEEKNKAKPGEVFATVGKVKYRVNFGVRGKKKEEVAKDNNLLAELIKVGSRALSQVK